MVGVTKYLRQYFKPSPSAVQVLKATYTRNGATLPAAVYKPARMKGRAPAWVVLHGLTATGLDHPGLQRFASALAASGHVVFIPEIHEWTQLLVAPALTTQTIRAAMRALGERSDVAADRVGVFGFSFGATQGIIAAADDDVVKHARTLVAWGGYSDLDRLVHFGLTGEHEIDGVQHHIDPDPYGRWMFGGNYLTSIPGYEHMQPVANALMELAREAGRSGIYAGDPSHGALVRKLAHPLNSEERSIYELFAPIEKHDMVAAGAMAKALATTIAAKDPLMDPRAHFARVRVPILLTHGRDDRLVPYTETVRMQRLLPAQMVSGCTITSLFAHSGGTQPNLHAIGLAREAARFIAVLNRILTAL